MEKFISTVHYRDLLMEFTSHFFKEFGERKLIEIANKVNASATAQKFIKETKNLKLLPGTDDYINTIHSIFHFTFAKAEIITAASISLLCMWELNAGKPNGNADDAYLNKIFFRILDKCDKFKFRISGKPNFFNRFYTHLDSTLPILIEKRLSDLNKTNPNYWIEIAVTSIKYYNGNNDFETINNSDFSFFILNCGLIYLIKFQADINIIGWDYSNKLKGFFIDLILEKANNYYANNIKSNDDIDFFDDRDRLDFCLREIAKSIDRFCETGEIIYLRTVAYNVFDSPMIIDFVPLEHDDDDDTIKLCGEFIEALSYFRDTIA